MKFGNIVLSVMLITILAMSAAEACGRLACPPPNPIETPIDP